MSVLKCDVQMDNPKTIYVPGDRLSGRVILTLEVRLLLKAVGIKYTGFAEVKWETLLPQKTAKKSKKKSEKAQEDLPSDEPPEQRVEAYTNREDFLSNINYLMGSEEAIARIVDRGVYTYPFTVTLPQSCPSSFESTNGHIRYMIEGFVDHKNKSEVWYKQQLHVVKPLELRQCPRVPEHSYDVHVEEKLPCKIFKKPLQIVVNLLGVGFVPGEAISILVSIKNPGKTNLNELTFALHQVCRITASHGHEKTKTRYFWNTLAKAVHRFRGPQEVIVQQLETLFVPQTVPNTDPCDCRCLQVSYELSVSLSTNNAKRCLQAKVPITVGTVSLQCEKAAQQLEASESIVSPNIEENNAFAAATAPVLETNDCHVSMMSLASSFRDAEYLPKTKFHAGPMGSKHKELKKNDFKPKYLYYDMDNALFVQNAGITTSTIETAATNTTDSPNLKQTD